MSRSGREPENRPPKLSRRDFVCASAFLTGAAALGGCGRSPVDPADGGGTDDEPAGDPWEEVVDPTASVYAVTGTHLPTMTRQLLDDMGGIGTVVHEGERVFIKPNMVSLPGAPAQNVFAYGECTKPEILVAVAEACLQAGASEVTIGDGSHAVTLPWEHARTLDGSTNLAAEAARLSVAYGRPVRVASLEADSPEWVEVPSDTYLGPILVSSLVAEADRVISVPVAKTHSWAQLTLSLKNFVGVTPLWRYGNLAAGIADRGVVFDHGSPAAIAAIYLAVVQGVKPDLAIVDFSIGIEGNGPNRSHGGVTVDLRHRLGSWLLLGSTDLVAADAMAAWIMSHRLGDVAQLGMAHAMGLGEYRQRHIAFEGPSLESLRVPWARARLLG